MVEGCAAVYRGRVDPQANIEATTSMLAVDGWVSTGEVSLGASGQGKPEDKQPSSQDHLVRAPAITLPKGGGAIHGIDERFSVNAATGTASLAVPIFTTPGRSGFHPQLSLSYDSGAGNGPFGLGWSLSVPAIARKTDKAVPLYRDEEDSDTFILSGAEDLVPVLARMEAPGEARSEGDVEEGPMDPVMPPESRTPTLVGLAVGLSGVRSSVLPRDSISPAVAADEEPIVPIARNSGTGWGQPLTLSGRIFQWCE